MKLYHLTLSNTTSLQQTDREMRKTRFSHNAIHLTTFAYSRFVKNHTYLAGETTWSWTFRPLLSWEVTRSPFLLTTLDLIQVVSNNPFLLTTLDLIQVVSNNPFFSPLSHKADLSIQLSIQLSNKGFKYLGIFIIAFLENLYQANYPRLIEKIKEDIAVVIMRSDLHFVFCFCLLRDPNEKINMNKLHLSLTSMFYHFQHVTGSGSNSSSVVIVSFNNFLNRFPTETTRHQHQD